MARSSPDLVGSEGDATTAVSETESESPLAKSRGGEANQSTDTTGQDNSPVAHNLPQIDLPFPQYHSSSSTTAESTYQRSQQTCSFPTKKTISVSVQEPTATKTERETPKTCSESEGRLSDSPVDKYVVRTDRDVGATVQRNVSAMSMAFSLEATKERLSLQCGHDGGLMEKEGETDGRRLFRAKINPASNSQAEEELRKHIR